MSKKTLVNIQKVHYKEETKYRALNVKNVSKRNYTDMYSYLIDIGCFAVIVNDSYIITEVSSIFHLDIKFGDSYYFNEDLN